MFTGCGSVSRSLSEFPFVFVSDLLRGGDLARTDETVDDSTLVFDFTVSSGTVKGFAAVTDFVDFGIDLGRNSLRGATKSCCSSAAGDAGSFEARIDFGCGLSGLAVAGTLGMSTGWETGLGDDRGVGSPMALPS